MFFFSSCQNETAVDSSHHRKLLGCFWLLQVSLHNVIYSKRFCKDWKTSRYKAVPSTSRCSRLFWHYAHYKSMKPDKFFAVEVHLSSFWKHENQFVTDYSVFVHSINNSRDVQRENRLNSRKNLWRLILNLSLSGPVFSHEPDRRLFRVPR